MARTSKPARPLELKDAAKLLTEAASYRYNLNDFFRDFVAMAALSLRNGFEPKNDAWHKREAEYLSLTKRYERPALDAMAHSLGSLMLIAKDGYRDLLGELYMSLDLGSKCLGQFFTPMEVSRLMARLSLTKEGVEQAIARRGYVSVMEPACGAGGMVIAVAETLIDMGFDPVRHLRVTAQDIDRHCCNMTFVACTAYRIPAEIVWGDALALEERDIARTSTLWQQILARTGAPGTPAQLSEAA